MPKAGMSFKDVTTGFKYTIEAINDELKRNVTIKIPEKSGTMALVDDLTKATEETNKNLEELDNTLSKDLEDLSKGVKDGNVKAGDAKKLNGQLPSYYATADGLSKVISGSTKVAKATTADNALKLNGKSSSHYATASDLSKVINGSTKVAKATTADNATKFNGKSASYYATVEQLKSETESFDSWDFKDRTVRVNRERIQTSKIGPGGYYQNIYTYHDMTISGTTKSILTSYVEQNCNCNCCD